MTVREVLLDHRIHRAAALGDVALQATDEPGVVVGVDEHLDVHLGAERGVGEDQDALDDDRAARRDGLGAVRADVTGEVVERRLDGAAGLQLGTCRTIRSVSSESGWS